MVGGGDYLEQGTHRVSRVKDRGTLRCTVSISTSGLFTVSISTVGIFTVDISTELLFTAFLCSAYHCAAVQ